MTATFAEQKATMRIFMPIPLIKLHISIDDFEVMPHRIGWKHEYWDGCAHLSPSNTAIADFQLSIWPQSDAIRQAKDFPIGKLRTPEPKDAYDLKQLHSVVFESAIEYAGHDETNYQKSIAESIAAFFGTSPGRGFARGHLGYSRVVELNGRLIAAMLVRHGRTDGFVVQPIMVAAEHQRAGIGKCLVDAVRIALGRDEHFQLNSRCHLGNADSMAWHRAVGFEEQPSMFAASHRAHHHAWMARHHQKAGRDLEAHFHRELAEVNAQLKLACEQIKTESQ